jgi:hypothetical protein
VASQVVGEGGEVVGWGQQKEGHRQGVATVFFSSSSFFFFSKRLYQTKEESICFACEEPMTSFPDEEKIIAKPPFSARCQSK